MVMFQQDLHPGKDVGLLEVEPLVEEEMLEAPAGLPRAGPSNPARFHGDAPAGSPSWEGSGALGCGTTGGGSRNLLNMPKWPAWCFGGVRSPGQLGLDISMFQEIDTYPSGLQAGKCHDKDQDKKTRWRLST
ncbi:uncharacterized protein GJ701_005657 isoform 1-T1 [Geothlypis trichas]